MVSKLGNNYCYFSFNGHISNNSHTLTLQFISIEIFHIPHSSYNIVKQLCDSCFLLVAAIRLEIMVQSILKSKYLSDSDFFRSGDPRAVSFSPVEEVEETMRRLRCIRLGLSGTGVEGVGLGAATSPALLSTPVQSGQSDAELVNSTPHMLILQHYYST